MKNISDKTKKWRVVTGGLVICAMLIVMISSQFRKEPIEDTLPNQNTEVGNVIIEKLNDTEKAEKEEITNSEDKIDNKESKEKEIMFVKQEEILENICSNLNI